MKNPCPPAKGGVVIVLTSLDNRPSKQPGRQTLKSLITDFQTNPLPVRIWNCLVLYIVISVVLLLIRIGVIVLADLVHFLLIIY